MAVSCDLGQGWGRLWSELETSKPRPKLGQTRPASQTSSMDPNPHPLVLNQHPNDGFCQSSWLMIFGAWGQSPGLRPEAFLKSQNGGKPMVMTGTPKASYLRGVPLCGAPRCGTTQVSGGGQRWQTSGLCVPCALNNSDMAQNACLGAFMVINSSLDVSVSSREEA